MPKSLKNHTFLKKAEMLETVCFTIENVVLGTSKVINYRSKIFAKSMQEKGMQKVWKMMPKGSQNESKKEAKSEAKKRMEKGTSCLQPHVSADCPRKRQPLIRGDLHEASFRDNEAIQN